MANGEMKAKLVVQASTEGDEEIVKLRAELDKLAGSADQAGPEFKALAAEINKLGEQRATIAEFERLKTATTEAAARLQQLQQATRAASLALKEKQAALVAANAAQQAQSSQLAQAQAQQSAMAEAIKQLGAELKTMAQAAKASGDSSGAMAQKLAEGQAQLALLKTEYKSATANITALTQAHQESAKASKEAQQQTSAAQKQFDGLRQSSAQAKQALASQNQELQRARDALAAMGLSSKALAEGQTQTNKGLDATRESLAALAKKAEEAAGVLANRELLGVRAHADVQKEIEKTRQAYEQLKASGKLTHAELAQAALKTEERVRELGKQTNGWTDSLAKAKMEFAGLAASGAGLAVIAKKAIDFETAMSGVAKVTNATEAQMKELEAQIKEMTRTIPLAATELAAMAAAGGQLGVPIEKLREFTDLAAKMATAFNMSAEQAGQAVAKLSNIFSLPIAQVRALGDAINTLGNNTAAREADIVEVLTRIGGTAKQFGLSAQQAAALGTALLSLGTQAEVAGTGINAILSKLQTAGIQSKEFQLALGSIGVSAQQLAKDIRNNPQKALSEFLDTLSKLEGGKQAEVLAQLFGLEYQDDVARLLAGLEGYRKALGLVGDAAKTAGAMQKEFEVRAKTTASELKLLKNSVDEVGINLGSVFLPVIRASAEALRDGAQAVATFAEQNPKLAAVGGTLLTLGVNVGALTLGLKALQVAAHTALPGMAAGAVGASTAVGGLLTVLRAALGPIAAVWAAFEAGQYVGEKLSTKFVEVERAGIALAGGLTKAAAMAQAAWEMMKAPFTDDTIEAAQERLRVKLAQIDDEYAALFANAGKAKTAVQEQGQSADAAAQANTKASTAVQAVANKMQELAVSAKAAGQNAQGASTQLEQVFAQAIKGASSVAVVQQLREKLQEAQAAGQLTADAAARLRVQLDQVGASKGAEEMVTEFHALKTSAEGVQGAVDELVKKLKFDDKASIAAFTKALENLGSTGALSARQVDEAWQQALGKLNTHQLDNFALAAKLAFKQGALSAQEFAKVNEQILAASFDKLGVNAAQALGKISTGAQEAIRSVSLVADSAKAAGVGVQETARAIEMAFAAAIPKADSLQAIEALEQQLKAMGAAGQISAQGLERTQAALDKQRATIEGQIPGIQSLEEALRNLGITPQKELDALATSAKQAFDAVKASGTATPREINEAWKAMAEAAIAANNGVADAVIQAEAEARGFAVVTDESGKSVIKTLSEVQNQTEGVGDALGKTGEKGKDALGKIDYAAQMAGKSIEELQAIMGSWRGGKGMADSAAMANAAADELTKQWKSAQVEADKYYTELYKIYAKHQEFAMLNPWQLEDTIWRASKALQDLDQQQQAIERSSSDASQGLQSLEDRLLELSGSEEDVARRRKERDQAEIQKKIALLQLDIQRANIRKNAEEAALLGEELKAYRQQLQLIEQIYQKEKKMHEDEERAAKKAEKQRQQEEQRQRQQEEAVQRKAQQDQRAPTKLTIAAAPTPTAPSASTPISIILNVNGINDPVKLARLIEPELKKMAALAR